VESQPPSAICRVWAACVRKGDTALAAWLTTVPVLAYFPVFTSQTLKQHLYQISTRSHEIKQQKLAIAVRGQGQLEAAGPRNTGCRFAADGNPIAAAKRNFIQRN